MQPVYIIDTLRTPIGKYGGALSAIRPDDLLAQVLRGLVARNEIDPTLIEDVIAGASNQSGEDNRNVARMAVLLAGLPASIGGVTVNRLCASGLQAIMDAARALQCGDGNVFIAAGVESMSRAPFVMAKATTPFSRTTELFDTTMGWRFTNPQFAQLYPPYSMGETAENVATRWQISRMAQDAFALGSQEKYAIARQKGLWEEEIMAVEISNHRREVSWVTEDEHPRSTSMEQLAKLSAAFVENGTVTAGNSSGINDGAAAMLLTNEMMVQQLNITPMAKIIGMAVAGVDPAIMGMGPVPATKKALQRAGITLQDVGLFEINEAFAAQSVACIQELSLDPTIVNVNGGAIAIGHPLGCSGVRISTTLLFEMLRRGTKYGVATMCVGVGQGAAIVYELIKNQYKS